MKKLLFIVVIPLVLRPDYIIQNIGKAESDNYEGTTKNIVVFDQVAQSAGVIGGYSTPDQDNGHCLSGSSSNNFLTLLIPEHLISTGTNYKTYVQAGGSSGTTVSPVCYDIATYLMQQLSSYPACFTNYLQSGKQSDCSNPCTFNNGVCNPPSNYPTPIIGEYINTNPASNSGTSYCYVGFPINEDFGLQINTDLLAGKNNLTLNTNNIDTNNPLVQFMDKNKNTIACSLKTANGMTVKEYLKSYSWFLSYQNWIQQSYGKNYSSGGNQACPPGSTNNGGTCVTNLPDYITNKFQQFKSQYASFINDLNSYNNGNLNQLPQGPSIPDLQSLTLSCSQGSVIKNASCAGSIGVDSQNNPLITYGCLTQGYSPSYEFNFVFGCPSQGNCQNSDYSYNLTLNDIQYSLPMDAVFNVIKKESDISAINCGFCGKNETMNPTSAGAPFAAFMNDAQAAQGFPFSISQSTPPSCCNGFVASFNKQCPFMGCTPDGNGMSNIYNLLSNNNMNVVFEHYWYDSSNNLQNSASQLFSAPAAGILSNNQVIQLGKNLDWVWLAGDLPCYKLTTAWIQPDTTKNNGFSIQIAGQDSRGTIPMVTSSAIGTTMGISKSLSGNYLVYTNTTPSFNPSQMNPIFGGNQLFDNLSISKLNCYITQENPACLTYDANYNEQNLQSSETKKLFNINYSPRPVMLQQKLDNQLIVAVQDNSLDSVKAILAQGASSNATDQSYGQNTALSNAAARGYTNIVKELISNGADPLKGGNISQKNACQWTLSAPGGLLVQKEIFLAMGTDKCKSQIDQLCKSLVNNTSTQTMLDSYVNLCHLGAMCKEEIEDYNKYFTWAKIPFNQCAL